MNRRQLLARIPVVLLAIPMLRCASEEPYPPQPGGQGGGGDDEPDPEVTSFRVENNDGSGHTHWFEMTCEQMQNGQTVWQAQGGHTHNVTLTADQLADILDGKTVTVETTGGHPHTWSMRMPDGMSC